MNSFYSSDAGNLKKRRRLKRYSRLLLKHQSDLSNSNINTSICMGNGWKPVWQINCLASPQNKRRIMTQTILCAFSKRDHPALQTVLNYHHLNAASNYIKISMMIFRQHLHHIKNSFKYPLYNGWIEEINNKINVLNLFPIVIVISKTTDTES